MLKPTRNKLLSSADRARIIRNTGEPVNEARCSGRTTACALSALAQALREPNTKVVSNDHTEDGESPHRRHNVAARAVELSDRLGLKFVRRHEDGIVCELLEY